MSHLSEEEKHRFDRQIRLPSCGEKGQLKLRNSTVLVVGAGGLGSAVLSSLAMSGVGQLIIYDFDRVSLSNLHRQSLYQNKDIGAYKVEVAKKRLLELNPFCNIRIFSQPLRRYNTSSMGLNVDLLVDCTDRFDVRCTIAELAHEWQIPHLYASVSGRDGQVALFKPNHACFRCLFKDLPGSGVIQSCDLGGVLGVTPQMIGAIQAQLAIDYLLAQPQSTVTSQSTNLQLISTQPFTHHEMKISRSPDCLLCGSTPTSQQESNLEVNLTNKDHPEAQAIQQAIAVEPYPIPISVGDVNLALYKGWNPHIIDVRSQAERALGYLPHSIHIELNTLSESLNLLLNSNFDPLSIDQKLKHVIEQLKNFSEEKDILVYCQRNPRAEKASLLLHQWNLKTQKNALVLGKSSKREIYELVGGYSGWSSDQK